MTFERTLVRNCFQNWKTLTHLKYNEDGKVLASRVLQSLKKSVSQRRELHRCYLKVAKQHERTFCLKLCLIGWFRYNRTRGKRSRLLHSSLYMWKHYVGQLRSDRRILDQTRKRLEVIKVQRCIKQWKRAMRISFAVYCIQLERIVSYILFSRELHFPMPFISRSPRLSLIFFWRRVSMVSKLNL